MSDQKVYDLLEKNDAKFGPICRLYSWSENYEKQNPFSFFLDVIGYSKENFGDTLTNWRGLESVLGYLEIDMLADALTMYAEKPNDVDLFIDSLFSMED